MNNLIIRNGIFKIVYDSEPRAIQARKLLNQLAPTIKEIRLGSALLLPVTIPVITCVDIMLPGCSIDNNEITDADIMAYNYTA